MKLSFPRKEGCQSIATVINTVLLLNDDPPSTLQLDSDVTASGVHRMSGLLSCHGIQVSVYW